MIANAHHLLALLTGAAGLGLVLLVAAAAARGRPGRFAADRTILLALGLVGLGVASGLAMLLGGDRPADALHLLYAVVALLVLPVARFWGPLGRHRALALAVGGVLLAGLVVRLFQTG